MFNQSENVETNRIRIPKTHSINPNFPSTRFTEESGWENRTVN